MVWYAVEVRLKHDVVGINGGTHHTVSYTEHKDRDAAAKSLAARLPTPTRRLAESVLMSRRNAVLANPVSHFTEWNGTLLWVLERADTADVMGTLITSLRGTTAVAFHV